MGLFLAAIIGFVIGGLTIGIIGNIKTGKLNNRHSAELKAQADRFAEESQKLNGSLIESNVKLEEMQRSHQKEMEAKEQTLKEIIATKEQAFNTAREEQEQRHKEIINAQERRHAEAADAMQKHFDEVIAKVSAQVKTATDDMLRQRQKEFAEASNSNLGQIVNPLKETIDKMKQAMNDNTLSQTKMSTEMKTKIEDMIKQSAAAKESADELTRVFKHESKVQGDWGETVLTELLESQGLTPGIHYDTQPVIRDASGNTIKSEDNRLMRPDVILHLDQKREVIIDSKVSLTAFMDYVNAENEEERKAHLKIHIESLKKHVKELAEKDYSNYIQPPKIKMDYVIMFVPHSNALWTALNEQHDLWRNAMDRNVFIADEQTLFAALKMINLTWIQIKQVQNHEKVYELANEMLNRVGQFMKSYEALGKAFTSAQKAYEEGEKKLSPQGQSILQTAGKLIKLGAKQSKKNPIAQLENSMDYADEIEKAEETETGETDNKE